MLREFAKTGSVTVLVEDIADEANYDLYSRGFLARTYVGPRNDEVCYEISDAGQDALDRMDDAVSDAEEYAADMRATCREYAESKGRE